MKFLLKSKFIFGEALILRKDLKCQFYFLLIDSTCFSLFLTNNFSKA